MYTVLFQKPHNYFLKLILSFYRLYRYNHSVYCGQNLMQIETLALACDRFESHCRFLI